jgi:flavin reductase (DIM6/NTAB) family NADH-FMN oxidoreductase RutF
MDGQNRSSKGCEPAATYGVSRPPGHAAFSTKDFRSALGSFPTGVAVVTTLAPDRAKIGVTVNSFTSVSLCPPLISFNLARSLHSIAAWLTAETFAVNVLRETQGHLSASFARGLSDKWSQAECFDGRTSCPILSPNLATFECERFACHEAGDHIIMIGKVVHLAVEGGAQPLVFYRGGYRSIGGLI